MAAPARPRVPEPLDFPFRFNDGPGGVGDSLGMGVFELPIRRRDIFGVGPLISWAFVPASCDRTAMASFS